MADTCAAPGVGAESETPTKSAAHEASNQIEPTYTDEQLLAIVQNRQLQLSDIAFKQLDFSRATAVAAYSGLLDQMAKLAQGNIKNKQEAGTQGAIEGAAGMIAAMLRSIDRNADMPLVNKEPDPTIEAPELGEEFDNVELVPGNMTIGTENLSKEDFLRAPDED